MSDDKTLAEIAELWDAMGKCGIRPGYIEVVDRPGCKCKLWMLDELYGGSINNQILHILRGISEEWLMRDDEVMVERSRGSVVVTYYNGPDFASLPEALLYANTMKGEKDAM